MQGLILAAGRGSRLAELNLVHKSFAEVRKKHIIDYSLELISGRMAGGIAADGIVVVVGYHAESIIEYIGDEYHGIPVTYVYQHERKGIAHAVLTAAEAIHDDFVMCLADEILINPQLQKMREQFERSGCSCLCGVIEDGEDLSMKPIAYEVSEDGLVTRVREKPDFYSNAYRGVGECMFRRDTLELLKTLEPNPRRNEYEMGDWIQKIVDGAPYRGVRLYRIADAYVNINYPKDIEDAEKIVN